LVTGSDSVADAPPPAVLANPMSGLALGAVAGGYDGCVQLTTTAHQRGRRPYAAPGAQRVSSTSGRHA